MSKDGSSASVLEIEKCNPITQNVKNNKNDKKTATTRTLNVNINANIDNEKINKNNNSGNGGIINEKNTSSGSKRGLVFAGDEFDEPPKKKTKVSKTNENSCNIDDNDSSSSTMSDSRQKAKSVASAPRQSYFCEMERNGLEKNMNDNDYGNLAFRIINKCVHLKEIKNFNVYFTINDNSVSTSNSHNENSDITAKSHNQDSFHHCMKNCQDINSTIDNSRKTTTVNDHTSNTNSHNSNINSYDKHIGGVKVH